MKRSDRFEFIDDDGGEHCIRAFGHNLLLLKCENDVSTMLIGDEENPANQLPGHSRLAKGMVADLQERLMLVLGEDVAKDGSKRPKLFSKQNQSSNWCEVVAIGPKCGTLRSKAVRKKLGVGPNYLFCIDVGDSVALPECTETGRMWNGLLGYPGFIACDECVPFAVVKRGE